jgi:hypothetical protein
MSNVCKSILVACFRRSRDQFSFRRCIRRVHAVHFSHFIFKDEAMKSCRQDADVRGKKLTNTVQTQTHSQFWKGMHAKVTRAKAGKHTQTHNRHRQGRRRMRWWWGSGSQGIGEMRILTIAGPGFSCSLAFPLISHNTGRQMCVRRYDVLCTVLLLLGGSVFSLLC